MDNILFYLLPVAVLAVAVVLLLGLINMARGGNPERSQSLMRWRVLLQAFALLIAIAAVYFASR